MSNTHFVARNRWFILGLSLLLLNSYAVYLYRASLGDSLHLRAALTTPKDGLVSGSDLIRWRFSRDMVSASATGAWSPMGPVKFVPDVKGSFAWTLPNELTFRPNQQWKLCTDFQAIFSDDLRSIDLEPLTDESIFDLHSESLTLKNVSQSDYSKSQGLSLQLEFSAKVAPDQVRGALSITNSAGQNIEYRIRQQSCGSVMTVIIPSDPSDNDVTLHLSAGLQSVAGARGLERAVSRKIEPTPALRVVKVEPVTRSFGPNSIIVSFNRPIALESVSDFLKVDPSLTVSVESGSRYYWRSENAIRIVGNFKPGQSYVISLLKGLPASKGASLHADIVRTAYFPDAAPGLEITATGNYMSPHGNMVVPYRTTGMNKCRATLCRVYPNNLVYMATQQYDYYRYYPGDGLTREVAETEIVIDKDPNSIADGRLSLRELIGNKSGVFYLRINATNGKDHREQRYHVIVSDIGLTIKKSDEGILVWANSIRTLRPIAGATVKVFSLENQELLSATTDPEGLASLSLGSADSNGTPFMVTVQKDDDLTYLALPESEVEIKGGVGKRPFLADGYEAYLFTDRGIYRPGETTHLKAVIRGKDTICPPQFPVQLNVYRPDNRLDRSLSTMLTSFGTAEFEIAWPDFTGTGRYRFDLTLPASKRVLGSRYVAVEDFVPPQIKVAVKTEAGRCKAGENIPVDIRADYLFGRPAAGLISEARVEFIPLPADFPQFPGFRFGDSRKDFKNVRKRVGKRSLNESGKAHFIIKTSPEWRPPAAIKAVIIGTVHEIGGRASSAYSGRIIDVYPYYVGIRCGDGDIRVGKEHTVDAVTVSPDGTITGAVERLEMTVEKLNWVSVLKKGSRGSYTYCSEQQVSRVITEEVSFVDGKGKALFTPASGGEYRLSFNDPASGASSSIELYAGTSGQRWNTRSMESPDVVELTFDKERYVAGDTATLTIKAPFTGTALVTIDSTHEFSSQVLVMEKNTAELKILVKPEYAPNVYCGITLIRPVVSEKLWSQHRAVGRASLAVDVPERKATMNLTVADTIRPQTTLTVDIQVTDGNSSGVSSEVVVAAVDEGICLLTGFKSPDPYSYFMEPRLPATSLCDIYSFLMPELEKTISGAVSSSGGDLMGALGRRLNPIKARRFKPVALWSSTVMTDADGQAKVQFDIPEFTGQLRIMAVAVGTNCFATAQKRVSVRSPLVVQSSLPRFLAPSDSFTMPVQIMNETGKAGEATVRVVCTGSMLCDDGSTSVLKRIVMAKGGETNLLFGLMARVASGHATCLLEVEMAGERFSEEVELAVRPPAGRVSLTGMGRVAKGKDLTLNIPGDWLEKTGNTKIWLSSLPGVELGGSLNYLIKYPYGCLEQTTSKSFPLLYLYELAEQTQPGWLDREQISHMVQAGVQRILTMQRSNGSFSLWRGGDTYVWGSIYATHFLVEAKKAGYQLPDQRISSACDYLEKWMAQKTKSGKNRWQSDQSYNRSYACYVLALAGRPQHGWMARLSEQDAKLAHDTKVNLAAALIASGKRREGHKLLGNIEIAGAKEFVRQTGDSLRSNVRDDAMLLSVLLELDPEDASIPGLVHRLESYRENGRWYTTQENAMALLALGKYCNILTKDAKPISGRITWNAAPPQKFTDKKEYYTSAADSVGGRAIIHNAGPTPIYYYWKSEGVPADGRIKEEDRGLKVRRELLDLTGKPLPAGALHQGDLLVMKVTLETRKTSVENIVIEDLLPACLEIENANLKTSQAVTWCKSKQTLPLLHTDIRDDRMVAFAGRFSGKKTYFYAVRAVTPGEFVMPAILATCMYDPGIRSVNGAGRIRVVATTSK
jgi:uncharacterized protein YfaS (alpha-2-macroglobulin family)